MIKPISVRLAETLAVAWVLGGSGHIPLSGGRLDRALKRTAESGLLGDMHLSFSDTSVGLRCLDLDEAILWGQGTMVFEIDGSSFSSVRPTLDEDLAHQLAISLGIGRLKAEAIGRSISEAIRTLP